MSASAAGGRRLPPLSKVVNTNKVVSVVAGATLLTYVFTEIRFRASAKAGKVPITLTNVRDKLYRKRIQPLPRRSQTWSVFLSYHIMSFTLYRNGGMPRTIACFIQNLNLPPIKELC